MFWWSLTVAGSPLDVVEEPAQRFPPKRLQSYVGDLPLVLFRVRILVVDVNFRFGITKPG